jgi:hypothetical protein
MAFGCVTKAIRQCQPCLRATGIIALTFDYCQVSFDSLNVPIFLFYLQEIPKPQDYGQFWGVLGAIVFLGAFSVFCYFKFGAGGNGGSKKDANGSGKSPKAGELDPAVWDQRIEAACVKAIQSQLTLPVETIKLSAIRIESDVAKQGESQSTQIGKLADAVNRLALAIAKSRGIASDD